MKNLFNKLCCKLRSNSRAVGTCSVCDQSRVLFAPLPDFYREQATKHGYKHFGMGEMTALETYSCTTCGASDRERLYAYWIDKAIKEERLAKGSKLLHFAPEAGLSKKLQALNMFDYKTADFGMDGVDYKVDMTNMPSIRSNEYDFFICSHVLEHVESDDKAIQELYRITKQGGCGILMAPIITNLAHTHEDPTMTTSAQRIQHFGQDDHVRLYAHDDYVAKIEKYGFSIAQLGIEYFGRPIFTQLGLKDTSILYIVSKA